jgi:hypothetical protein
MSYVYFREENLFEKINMLSRHNTELQFESKKTSNMDNEMRWTCGISMGNLRILTIFFLFQTFAVF